MKVKFNNHFINSTKKILELSPFKTKTIKIAITGLSRAGKSVFITSFLDELINSKAFQAKLNPPKLFMKRFDYYHYVKQIKKENIWCDTTKDITCASVRVEKTHKFLPPTSYNIELYDYPGEWLMDLIMLKYDFDTWSHMVFDSFKNHSHKSASEYLQMLEKCDNELDLHVKYCEVLKKLKCDNFCFLTPGRFLVPSDMKDDPNLIFAPIFKNNSSMYKNYKKRYELYVNEVVKKIHLQYFRGFDRQIMLIDVLSILKNSFECFSDLQFALKQILSVYSYKKTNFFQKILNPSIKHIAFVASKADLVPKNMHQNLHALLQELCIDLNDKLQIPFSTHIIASVKCTKSVLIKQNSQQIMVLRGYDKNKKLVEVYCGKIPRTFATKLKWNSEQFIFENFMPFQNEYSLSDPFENINMQKLIKTILNEKF